MVRGSLGEIVDTDCLRLIEPKAITKSQFTRYLLSRDLNLNGQDTELASFDGKGVYKNPLVGLWLMDGQWYREPDARDF